MATHHTSPWQLVSWLALAMPLLAAAAVRFFFIATVSPQRCELQEASVKDMRVKNRHFLWVDVS
jgi:hypothetical protein